MASILRIKRRISGAAGAPATLASAELAYNNVDGIFYAGKGDNSGAATSVVAFAGEGFWKNIPSDGAVNDVLKRTAGGVAWGPITQGTAYTATGNGIELSGTEFSLNYAEVATGIGLGNYVTATSLATTLDGYATDAELASGLSGKANTAHTHSAADITSGVFDIARIPVLPSSVQIVSSGGIAALTAPQQAEIGDGSIVTTTDGRRWVYTGTGSKTAEASYVELADITPDWAVIANKPAFATVATSGSYTDLSNRPTLATVATSGSYTDLSNRPTLATVATSGSYNDLTGKPTLGTMASQNANAVAITGGTIDGITFDGGVF